jgi:GNAT superfamily N-acetyltransferase
MKVDASGHVVYRLPKEDGSTLADMSVVLYTKDGNLHGVIDEIHVAKEHRRQGIATRLVGRAKDALQLESLVMSNHMTRAGASFRRAIEPDWKGKRVGPSDRWDDASLYLTTEQRKCREAEELEYA